MFKEFDPIKNKIFRIIDNNGKVINEKWNPKIDDQEVIKAYKQMLYVRTADQMAVSFQRQGRMFTYPPNYGQEAISQALSMVWRKDDWMAPAFRELGAWLAKGATMTEVFLYYMGYEDGTVFKNAENILPIAVPIASQLVHAAGLGYAVKYKKEDKVVYGVIGDGGTSHGDFHEALNFAAVWEAPVVFIIQNNQYAISVPLKNQTKSINLAVKGVAYNIPSLYVDGNDLFAMYAALKFATDHARSGKGPVLIEALTYRKGAHTTSDDPTKYRTKEEEELWFKTDPLDRVKSYLKNNKLDGDIDEEKLIEQYKQEVDRQFTEAENYPKYKLEDAFKYMYADMPDDLKNQMVEHENFLKWKEARK
ncbi:MAG: pyruvate dehydrogenase (acetyl-transferring) E1 component subunit alpha [Bacteroidetes bacterium]|jgi:pyruvate dehydrogenase E1 component alpha subunit|nr:pyruvate dehydrogenase (acetyl-transferring) E1 component subunit alpha [Bacteroidota bacterium]MBT3935021.1 pyruvate dehydrogenase (acetyl-transferring) E1 component subunit alpha [Bacteroidota bacterium]MBT4337807.1 pyruvate dehydrogenase (acetyl-transferring) E1 component subunit alpha [Bacteroidota bacterium]MBT4729860.1 pyruvate dehydrogenase (acetyl-transferring) E1 component subunit alpha [Bacteroidota bacterium]MBT5528943.1 pyruvate dehydrogenase (acetyl-transferring) E1 component su